MTERFVKTETGFERIDWTYHSYNAKGRLIETLHANHTRTETGWSCCGKANSTDASGITSRYGYDDLGRNTSVFNEATGLHTEFTYDAAGRRLISTAATGQPTTLTDYDELNQPIMTGLDVDGNGRLEPASSDRIEERHSGFVKSDGAWWQQERQLVYPETGSDRPTFVSTSLSRLSGWDDSLVAERIVIDSHGARTVFRETLERSRRLRSRIVIHPDSTIAEEHRMVNGLPVAATTRTGRTTTYRYDGLGRRIAVTDPRTGTTRSGYDEHHRLAFVEDGAGNRTSYAYDPQTGLKISETNADNKKTRFSYTPLGQLERRWGSAAYPVQYTYNDYGEQVALTTFRTEQGWDRPDWPEDATGDKTSWQYQESTGLLLATYDATGTGPRYTYDNAGRLQSRTWARGVVTRYGYLSTGELSSVVPHNI